MHALPVSKCLLLLLRGLPLNTYRTGSVVSETSRSLSQLLLLAGPGILGTYGEWQPSAIKCQLHLLKWKGSLSHRMLAWQLQILVGTASLCCEVKPCQDHSADSLTTSACLTFLAGCAALYPIDTIKTRLQSATHGGGLRALLQRGGGKALYSGLWGNLVGVAPASAIFMAVYNPVKQYIQQEVRGCLVVVALFLFGVQMHLSSSYEQLELAAWSTVLQASTTQSGMTCDLRACWPRCVCCACNLSASADACAGAAQWPVAINLAHLRCTLSVHKCCKQRWRCIVPDDTALIQPLCPQQRPVRKQAQATLPHLRFPALQPQTSDTYCICQAKQI